MREAFPVAHLIPEGLLLQILPATGCSAINVSFSFSLHIAQIR